MKFGVREICNVVLKAKAAMKVGDKVFYKNEPVCYFDSLKTSTMEGASTTVYAQGGRGNARLVAWEGERTVTFTMEDALISPIGFSILTGAGLISATDKHIIMHTTEKTDKVTVNTTGSGDSAVTTAEILVSQKPYIRGNATTTGTGNEAVTTYKANDNEDFIYVMLLDDHGEVASEPYIAVESQEIVTDTGSASNGQTLYKVIIKSVEDTNNSSDTNTGNPTVAYARKNDLTGFNTGCVVLVDYYIEKEAGAFQVDITPDRFGGNFYLEAETLFRDTNGVDMPAEFVIPNCKVQSNFTFTMASSGDPSTFTFTMDAFPDYTRWNKTKKVFAAIQVLESGIATEDFERLGTKHDNAAVKADYDAKQKPTIEELY